MPQGITSLICEANLHHCLINTDEDLGDYYAELGAFASVPKHLRYYIDTEQYGRDIRMEMTCCITSQGLINDNR